MDTLKAKKIEEILRGKDFQQYQIVELINNGKSAAVFKAIDKTRKNVAIKIFDNELIERFGHEIQETRIQQEISLKGHSIPNLIKIIDGGKIKIDEGEYYYVIMECIDGKNLKEFIVTDNYDDKFIRQVVETIYKLTEELLEKGIVHRDIKPENIMISNSGEIILMDLGVLKLIGVKSFTDEEETQFVGTLRYAPPEFLLRVEEDTNEGWRAVNLYQIGGLMHDMIMKQELFFEYTPYTKLVLAIKEAAPNISSNVLPFDTTQLARDLLMKDWKNRLLINSSKRIEEYYLSDTSNKNLVDKKLEDIFSMISNHKAKISEIEDIRSTNVEIQKKKEDISFKLELLVNECFNELIIAGIFDTIEKSKSFTFTVTGNEGKKLVEKNFLYKIDSDLSRGFPKPLILFVHFSNDENMFVKILSFGMFLGQSVLLELNKPAETLVKAAIDVGIPSKNNSRLFNTKRVFNGTISFDEQFKQKIKLEILEMVETALKGVVDDVNDELERRKKYEKGEITVNESNLLKKTKLFPETEPNT